MTPAPTPPKRSNPSRGNGMGAINEDYEWFKHYMKNERKKENNSYFYLGLFVGFIYGLLAVIVLKTIINLII